jgi:hypothetical protein
VSDEEMDADPVNQAWSADLERRGAEVYGVRLRPSGEATTVRVRGGETLVSDGPFAETKDLIGGIVVVDCALSTRPSRSPRDIRTPGAEAWRFGRSGATTFRTEPARAGNYVFGPSRRIWR